MIISASSNTKMELFIINIIEDNFNWYCNPFNVQFSVSVSKEFYNIPLNGRIGITENLYSPIFYIVSLIVSALYFLVQIKSLKGLDTE